MLIKIVGFSFNGFGFLNCPITFDGMGRGG